MPQAVHWKSTLPSRKSRNSGEWLRRHFLRRLSAKASLEQLPGLVDPEEVLLVGRLLVGVRRRDHHRVDLEVVVQEVEDVTDGLRLNRC